MKLEEKKLPNGWEVKKLGEVCIYSKGKMPKVLMEEKNEKCSVPYINIKAFERGIFSEYTNGEKCNLCDDDDLLMVWDGARCGLIGKAKKGAVGSTLMKILPKEIIHKEFLYYFISSKFRILNTKPRGVGIPHIEPSLLWNFELSLPPLPEQQAIVAKIEELFSELENGKKELLIAQAKLKTYRQSLLEWAFEGRLTNKNLKANELPKGWEVKKLGDVAKNKSKKITPADYPDAKFIGMDCIEPNTLRPKFIYRFGDFKSAGNYFEMGQVLYGRMRPYLNKVYKAEYEGACSGEFIVLQCTEKFYPNLLSYILHSKNFVNYANHKTNGDRPRISYEEIADYPIFLATFPEQQKIVAILESKLTICDEIEETIKTSIKQGEALRQSILKKAFEGELINKKNVT